MAVACLYMQPIPFRNVLLWRRWSQQENQAGNKKGKTLSVRQRQYSWHLQLLLVWHFCLTKFHVIQEQCCVHKEHICIWLFLTVYGDLIVLLLLTKRKQCLKYGQDRTSFNGLYFLQMWDVMDVVEQVSGFSTTSIPRFIEATAGLHSLVSSLAKTLAKHARPKSTGLRLCWPLPQRYWSTKVSVFSRPHSDWLYSFNSRQTEMLPGPKAHLPWVMSYPGISVVFVRNRWNSEPTCRVYKGHSGPLPTTTLSPRSENRLIQTFPVIVWLSFDNCFHPQIFICSMLLYYSNIFEFEFLDTDNLFPYFCHPLWSVTAITLRFCYLRSRRHYLNNAMTSFLCTLLSLLFWSILLFQSFLQVTDE